MSTSDHVQPQPADHRLWWRPGSRGRGVLFESGLVYTWPEGDATHRQLADHVPSRPLVFFYIRTDGRVRIPERHVHRAVHVTAALTAADPRLAPFTPPRREAHREAHPDGRHDTRPAPHVAPTVASHAARRDAAHPWELLPADRLARIQRRY